MEDTDGYGEIEIVSVTLLKKSFIQRASGAVWHSSLATIPGNGI
jgi:hypothetical protein